MKKPVLAFKPSLSKESIEKTAAQRKIQFEDQDHLSGREDERDVLKMTVQALAGQKVSCPALQLLFISCVYKGGVILLTGGRGSGKTQLVDALVDIGMTTFTVAVSH